jgi:threonine/homoserine/homoserine lactone efflux protein
MASALGSLAAGFLAGLAIAASPGPIFFLLVGRILERGRRSGFASGAGVATADGIYALVAALGIGVASAVLAGSGRWLAAAGGVALIALGLRYVLTRPANTTPASASAAGLVADYASTLALTIGNPQTIIAFLAVFAGARAGMGVVAAADCGGGNSADQAGAALGARASRRIGGRDHNHRAGRSGRGPQVMITAMLL